MPNLFWRSAVRAIVASAALGMGGDVLAAHDVLLSNHISIVETATTTSSTGERQENVYSTALYFTQEGSVYVASADEATRSPIGYVLQVDRAVDLKEQLITLIRQMLAPQFGGFGLTIQPQGFGEIYLNGSDVVLNESWRAQVFLQPQNQMSGVINLSFVRKGHFIVDYGSCLVRSYGATLDMVMMIQGAGGQGFNRAVRGVLNAMGCQVGPGRPQILR